jgi:hypothetical protein
MLLSKLTDGLNNLHIVNAGTAQQTDRDKYIN